MKKDKKFDSETLGGRMKNLEKEYDLEVGPNSHIICRIDGHKFSSYTRGFKKPFDEILSKAFELTKKEIRVDNNDKISKLSRPFLWWPR